MSLPDAMNGGAASGRLLRQNALYSQTSLRGDPPPTDNQVVAVLRALADLTHNRHMLAEAAVTSDDLADGLGLYFHRLADEVAFSMPQARGVGPRVDRRFAELPGFMQYRPDERPRIHEIDQTVKQLGQVIGECAPEGRQQELALEALEIVQMRCRRAFDIPQTR